MKILLMLGHPAHFHLFKNMITQFEKKGNICKIACTNKDVLINLLDSHHLSYAVVGYSRSSICSKIIEQLKLEYRLFKIAREFKPDILIGGVGCMSIAHIGKIIRKPSIIFDDTEHAKIEHMFMDPFATAICTPSCYRGNIGRKQIRYNGYHELAYLHPHRFTPNPSVLNELGLKEDDRFIIVRFVSWTATHDKGCQGLTIESKRRAIQEFSKYGRVFITSEKSLPEEFKKYQLTISPEKMHDFLFYATLLYGESATMASECAVLGTHAIFCDFAGRGYTDEEEREYNLVYNFKLDEESQKLSIDKAIQLLQDPYLKEKGREKRKILLNDKIDVTAFMVWLIEKYPKSIAMRKGDLITKKF